MVSYVTIIKQREPYLAAIQSSLSYDNQSIFINIGGKELGGKKIEVNFAISPCFSTHYERIHVKLIHHGM